jgi:HSP20 family molecular chaperone IbpA
MATETQEIQKRDARSVEKAERRSRTVFSPRADVYETADSIVVVADVPGVAESSIDITLEKNVLTIQGRTEKPKREGYKLNYGEYEEGDYERSFALSEGVDKEGIEATVRDGVLRLTLPKAREAVLRKIQVKTG